MSWAKQEFETIELGDARLNQRAVLLAERLGQKPGASIPGACENWAETAAAYRFLRNEQVGWEEVLSAHAQASQARIREHAVVLCIQDTTELDYNGQAMSGLGPLSFEAQRGLYLHPTYVVSPERECAVASRRRSEFTSVPSASPSSRARQRSTRSQSSVESSSGV